MCLLIAGIIEFGQWINNILNQIYTVHFVRLGQKISDKASSPVEKNGDYSFSEKVRVCHYHQCFQRKGPMSLLADRIKTSTTPRPYRGNGHERPSAPPGRADSAWQNQRASLFVMTSTCLTSIVDADISSLRHPSNSESLLTPPCPWSMEYATSRADKRGSLSILLALTMAKLSSGAMPGLTIFARSVRRSLTSSLQ
jgi:hypothetical protein